MTLYMCALDTYCALFLNSDGKLWYGTVPDTVGSNCFVTLILHVDAPFIDSLITTVRKFVTLE